MSMYLRMYKDINTQTFSHTFKHAKKLVAQR